MGTFSTEVFLASRFEEFKELRSEIKERFATSTINRNSKIEIIDLNDGNISHRPPLLECLSHVRRSELFILLLGDTYGAMAPNSTKSFTQLEYEESIREGSNTRVLVYCIGNNYTKNGITYSHEPKLAEWQKEIDKNHTWLSIEPTESHAAIAEKIYNQTISNYFELRSESLFNQNLLLDDIPEDIADFLSSDEDDVDKLELRYAQKNGIDLTDETENSSDIAELLRHPNRIACREHREEAMTAIELQAYGVAIQHLSRALTIRPLDLPCNYWLAKLYLFMGRKDKYRDIIELSERAIQIAQREATPYRVAVCYLMAADASAMANKHTECLLYAKKAVDSAPNYSKTHIGLAKNYLLQPKPNKTEALDEIKIAYRIYPPSIREVMTTPEFKTILPSIYELLREEKAKYKKYLDKIIETENKVAALLTNNSYELDQTVYGQNLTIKQIQDTGKTHIRQVWIKIAKLVSNANALKCDSGGISKRLSNRIAQERVEYSAAMNTLKADMHDELTKLGASYFAPFKVISFSHQVNSFIGLIILASLFFLSAYLIYIALGMGVIAIVRWRIWTGNIKRLKIVIARDRESKVQDLSKILRATEAEIGRQQHSIEQALNNAQQATKLLDRLLIELPLKILPFKPLSSAAAGDRVVISKYQLEKSGKSIVWNNSSSLPWETGNLESREFTGLAYIEEVIGQTLHVSAQKAYQE